MNLLYPARSPSAAGYQIERSLRFNYADAPSLTRTMASAATSWTVSVWLKRGDVSGAQYNEIFSSGTAGLGFEQTTNQFHSYDGSSLTSISGKVWRDPTAWMHVVLSRAAGSVITFYVNGTSVGTLGGWNLSTSTDQTILGRRGNTGAYWFDGLMAEAYIIAGQALTPTSFAETDVVTSQWKPKAFSGSFGSDDGYYKFADNSAATAGALGLDSSGNGKNLTPNNFSVTAGVGNDSLTDTPTNYGTDTGTGGEVRGNYCTWNPLKNSGTLNNGNLGYTTAVSALTFATFGMSSGKWYWELHLTDSNHVLGIATAQANMASYLSADAYSWAYIWNGTKGTAGTANSYGDPIGNGDIVGVAFDADNGTLAFYKNGVSPGTAYTGLTSGPYFPAICGNTAGAATGHVNFGQRPFAYTAPTGFKALCTENFSNTTVALPGSFTGNGSADGPWVWANGVVSTVTINGNVATEGTHFRKTAGGMKIITSSASYNTTTNTVSAASYGDAAKYSRAQ